MPELMLPPSMKRDVRHFLHQLGFLSVSRGSSSTSPGPHLAGPGEPLKSVGGDGADFLTVVGVHPGGMSSSEWEQGYVGTAYQHNCC